MVGTRPVITTDFATIPFPRRPLAPSDQVRRWYENELGWPVVPGTPGSPLSLRVGLRFDVLDVPAEAGRAALRHLTPHSPVAVRGERMRLLMSAGSAEEVPGVLDWLEWGTLPLDLATLGEGDLMEAPLPPEQGPVMAVRPLDTRSNKAVRHPDLMEAPLPPEQGPVMAVRPLDTRSNKAVRHPGVPEPGEVRPLPRGRTDAVQGAAVWLRPPEPGGEVEDSLPTLSAMGGGGGAPDLVRVLDTVATQCHRLRLRLRHGGAQPSADL
ncbi:SCO3374 family protein [Streptomyces sp. T21Q-yed]|uniref:SCO3374 family protein n=1 Tax=Streptomyces sp. T21Q-yed TaxID=3018441 RepID=UPI0023DFCB5F|nr:SCO3374 family protein [Streptomyces sp. T21Q-yed]MDF3143663.1 SCO3374 family protein [Streptomyces sp. T21Q-yed]